MITSFANSVGRMSTAEHITPFPSKSEWYELLMASYLCNHYRENKNTDEKKLQDDSGEVN